jgi:hypothetical protein
MLTDTGQRLSPDALEYRTAENQSRSLRPLRPRPTRSPPEASDKGSASRSVFTVPMAGAEQRNSAAISFPFPLIPIRGPAPPAALRPGTMQ